MSAPKRSRKKNQDNLSLKEIEPLTYNQEETFNQFFEGKHLILHGSAGTGKTFLSIYLSLTKILDENSPYKRLLLLRSVVPTRDMGFLPGNITEKSAIYEHAYEGIFCELFSRGDAYSILKTKNLVEFGTTSFLRGTTFNDCIVLVDEFQNMSFHELNSVITRTGKNCKLIFCGDLKQNDLKKEESGFKDFVKILQTLESFASIIFTTDDIVRSDLVKDYIVASNIYFNVDDSEPRNHVKEWLSKTTP